MWQPQEQKKRPKIAADTHAAAMNRNPAVTTPSSSVYMTSLSSSGASVLPASFQWTTWSPISRYTPARTAARRRPYRLGRRTAAPSIVRAAGAPAAPAGGGWHEEADIWLILSSMPRAGKALGAQRG
jgi:hypothetical protein